MDVLDAEELFHLAMKASAEGDADKAIRYYKQSLEQEERGETYYLLGAEYADLQMYDRAIGAIAKAVALNPNLATAHFQLGLLHLVVQNAEAARQALQPLRELPEEHYLYQMGAGLLAMIDERLDEAREALQRGMADNVENPALNGDVQKILDRLAVLSGDEQGGANPGGKSSADGEDARIVEAASQFLIANYQKTKQ